MQRLLTSDYFYIFRNSALKYLVICPLYQQVERSSIKYTLTYIFTRTYTLYIALFIHTYICYIKQLPK